MAASCVIGSDRRLPPWMSAAMLCAATLAMVSLIWRVLGTPAGTAVAWGGAMAIATPAA